MCRPKRRHERTNVPELFCREALGIISLLEIDLKIGNIIGRPLDNVNASCISIFFSDTVRSTMLHRLPINHGFPHPASLFKPSLSLAFYFLLCYSRLAVRLVGTTDRMQDHDRGKKEIRGGGFKADSGGQRILEY